MDVSNEKFLGGIRQDSSFVIYVFGQNEGVHYFVVKGDFYEFAGKQINT